MSKHAARSARTNVVKSLRRHAVVVGVALAILLLLAAVIRVAPKAVAPLSDELALAAAGVPEPGTPIFTETFSAQNASASGINILNYTGANGMTYDADVPYTPAGGQCNGWVMNSLTPQPTAAQDAGCANNQPAGWNQLRSMATTLGLAQGQTAAQAATNQVLTEYTNAPSGTIAAGYELKTESAIQATAGHYYAVSAYFAEINCFSNHARMTFSLVVNGTPTVLSSGLDPCTAPGVVIYPDLTRVVKLQSAAIQVPTTGTPTLGLQIYNAQANGNGNDVSFDLPQIVDVTPSLDKSFSPPLIAPGGVSTLTFTVTNTSELMAKADWSFTDNLPAGLKVAATPNVGGTCTSTTGAPLVRTANAGATSIAVTGGDLALNQVSCTVTVNVTSDVEGTYVNGPANVTTNLLPPENTPLEVRAPRIKLVKSLGGARIRDADQFTVQIRSGSAGGPVVNNTAASTTQGTGATVAAGTGTTGTYVADVNTTYFLTETATPGTDLGAYNKTITCVDANGRQTGLPSGATFSGSLSIKPVAGADITCTLTNTANPQPAITLLKRVASVDDVNGNGLTDLGDEINFVFDVSNTGNVTMSGIAIDDPLLADLGITVTCDPTTLAPGASVTCAADGPYVITQADVDAGTVENAATASGTPPSGPVVETPESPTVTPTEGAAGIDLVKTADRDALIVGDTMTYTFVATNTGTVTLTDVVIEETAFTGSGTVSDLACTPAAPSVLAPGDSMACTATYVVTQADVDAGTVDNTATTTGTPPSGPKVTDEDEVQVPGTSEPSIELVKSSDKTDLVSGETMTYTFIATNTGNVTLSDVVVEETAFTGSGSVSAIDCDPAAPSVLAPGESMECTATYVVTQADVDAGTVDNTATTTGTPPSGPKVTDEDEVQVPGTSEPAIELVKSSDKTDLVVGETMTYTFVATNTGNVTLSDVVIAESAFTGSGTVSDLACDPAAPSVLTPGASMECTATYVVTQADVDAGSVDNTASTTGTPPSGPKVTDEDDVQVPGTSGPGLALLKRVGSVEDVNGNGLNDLGDEINFVFDLENTGNVTLTDVSVDDPFLAGLGITVTCDPTTLAPGATVTCEADAPYVITQADVDAGTVENVATATGTPPTGPEVETPESPTVTPLDGAPAIELVKTADKSDLVVGETMTYTFVATNTGTVTLSDVVVEESAFTGSGDVSAISCDPVAPSVLAPGESMECIASYVVTQADVDAGTVDNTATTTGTPPSGPVVTDEDDVQVPGTQEPALSLNKWVGSIDDVNGNGLNDVGDEINFVFDLENTGDVTLTDAAVDDPLLAGLDITVTCDPTTLAPGASVTCVADGPYVITQADLDAGTVENVATATGTPPSGPVVETPESPTVTPLDGTPGIELVKTADKSDLVVGETMTYTFVATNTGNVTLSDVVVEESAFTGSGTVSDLVCDPAAPSVLAPGESMECTATYVVTQADVDAGTVDNTATTTGTPPSGPKVTDEAEVQVPGTSEPAIELVKSSDKTDLVVGETMTYTFVATNTGNVTLSDVVVEETAFTGSGSVSAIDCDPAAPSVLAPGESMECTATYVVTQADVDAGSVDNTATTTGTPPSGPVVTDEDEVQVPGTSEPSIELVKSSDKTDLVSGETMTYTFIATNTGNVTLSDVVVEETAFTGSGSVSAIDCDPAAPSVLAPGESMECTATYVVTQADVDAGSVDNTATTTGTPPSGPKVTDEDEVQVPGTSEPAIELVKSSDKTDLVVGETMTYTFVATNTGNVTLSDVLIEETAFTGSGTVSDLVCDPVAPSVLAPGASMECTATYVVTQADVDAGSVDNTATTTGTPPSGPVVTDEDEVQVPGTSEPSIELVKSSDKTDLVVGETMTYTFVATNTGNVTLSDVVIEETAFTGSGSVSAIDCAPAAPSVLAPGASMECTATYVVTQADVDAGAVDNTATTTGTPPSGPVVTDEDDVQVPATQEPSLSLNKRVASVVDVNGNGLNDLGDEINFVFDLENTGNVTLTDVAVDDLLLSDLDITVTCDPTTLAPGATVTCGADAPYVITQTDVDAGTVENVATAKGTPPTGPPTTSKPDETITELDDEPALTLDKRAATVTDVDGDGLTDAGDTIEYAFELVNTGNVTLTDLNVDDPMLVAAGITVSCPVTSLAPSEKVLCVADEAYIITAADALAGSVRNTATATYTPPGGTPVVSPPDSVRTPTEVPGDVSSGETPPGDGVLPNTGGPSLVLTVGAVMSVLAGLVLVGRGRRRHELA
ncbi:DUF11 domain-containing protein [Nocardioides sp. WS12]|uniref:DUF7507 domain-containing protein n=1 Tax=Nocardioides sp. WS12 TaxID=2486272 RepID=UPI0015FC2F3C|nr:DUF11 domain-containing protein [Nocardioides sp. WS12]